jgi:hypothetical protein
MWVMALAELRDDADAIPEDSFRVRIAIIRALRGWNVTQAGEACGIKAENWRLWEKTGRTPQNYEEVCRKIADGSRFSRQWIAAGGPLRSRCLYIVPSAGQQELPFPVARELVAV